MLWLLGSLGVSERERVVVFAESRSDAYALGALLFLVGHSRVSVWTDSVERLLETTNTGPGQTRGSSHAILGSAGARRVYCVGVGALMR